MGQVWAVGESAAAVIFGDFAFLAGDARSTEAAALLSGLAEQFGDHFLILTPRDTSWTEPIVSAFPAAQSGVRYAMKKEPEVFDRAKLKALCRALPPGICLEPINSANYDAVMEGEWSRDFCACFGTKSAFFSNGLGFIAVEKGVPVGGASSYGCYHGGIEIQVETRADHRRLGIAAACCARLILECLERGLYPSWDAANRASVKLAEKLGYHEKGAYPIWENRIG